MKVAYAGVWILCRTRLRRLGETGCNAEFKAAMGKGPIYCGSILAREGTKASKEENRKDDKVDAERPELEGSVFLAEDLSLSQAGDAGNGRHHHAGEQLHGCNIALVERSG